MQTAAVILPAYAVTVYAIQAKTALAVLRIASARPAANLRPAIAAATDSVKVLKTALSVPSIAARRLFVAMARAIPVRTGVFAPEIAEHRFQRSLLVMTV
jgi:hypothetical protein